MLRPRNEVAIMVAQVSWCLSLKVLEDVCCGDMGTGWSIPLVWFKKELNINVGKVPKMKNYDDLNQDLLKDFSDFIIKMGTNEDGGIA